MKTYIPKSKRFNLLTIYKRIVKELKSKDPLKNVNMMIRLNRKAFNILKSMDTNKKIVVFSSVRDQVKMSFKPKDYEKQN